MPVKHQPTDSTLSRLIVEARTGSTAALGRLFNTYRPFLLAIARDKLRSDLAAKAGPSDLVQETFVEAQRDFDRFRSRSPEDLKAWLCELLFHNLADLNRRYRRARKRSVERELSLWSLDSSRDPIEGVARVGASPSKQAADREELRRVELALAQLPEDHRQVILLRNRDGGSFVEVGLAMNRSPAAARMLWLRAMARFKRTLDG